MGNPSPVSRENYAGDRWRDTVVWLWLPGQSATGAHRDMAQSKPGMKRREDRWNASPCYGKLALFDRLHIAEMGAPWYSTQRTFKLHGPVAERLGSGLQNRLHRFDSGRDLFW